MTRKHRYLAAVIAGVITLWCGAASAQQMPMCAADGAATANGSGIVYIQYEEPAPQASSCAASLAGKNGSGLVYLQYDVPIVTNVQASDGTYVGKVVVTWDAGPGGAKYYVYRDGQLISAMGGITTTSFDDTTVSGYQTYAYTVLAMLDGGMSDASVADTGFSMADGVALKLAATDGTVKDRVDLSWLKLAGGDGYKVYRNNVLIKTLAGGDVLAYSDTDVAGSATKYTYAVSAYKGMSETTKSQDSGYANVPPTSVTGVLTVPMNQASSPFTPTVVDRNLPDDFFTFYIISQPANGSVLVVNNQLIYTPNASFQGNDTFNVQATDRVGSSVIGTVTARIDCPSPVMYGVNVAGDLQSVAGMAQVELCGAPDQVQVRLLYVTGGRTVRDVNVALTKLGGANNYYVFSDPISSLLDGTYNLTASLADSYSHTASTSKQIVIDWNTAASPKFTYKGAPINTGGTTAESLGNVGIKQ